MNVQSRVQIESSRVNEFILSVYNWMAIGLVLTGCIAWFVAHNESALHFVYQARVLFLVGEIGLVFFLSRNIGKLTVYQAITMFVAYAVLNGATMSIFFIIYSMQSIASVFFTCAMTFGACSVFGWVTKRDLTGLGNFMFMGLIGILIASVINIFLNNNGLQMIVSYIGVLVFTGLTAYDTQKIKTIALSQPAGMNTSTITKGAILGALTLYLDFILMFLYLLYIFGGRRD